VDGGLDPGLAARLRAAPSVIETSLADAGAPAAATGRRSLRKAG
jgi:hypothetical protein